MKQKYGAGSTKLPVCRYYEQLQFLHDTVSNDGNVSIEFSERASPNVESKVIEGEGSAMFLTNEIIPVERNGVNWRNLTQTIKKNSNKNFYSNQFLYTHKFFYVLELFVFQGLNYKIHSGSIYFCILD